MVPMALELHMVCHPRQHEVTVDGLGDEVDRTGLQTGALRRLVTQRREEDNRNGLAERATVETAADLQPIHPRHHHIEQHQINRAAREHQQRGFARRGNAYIILVGEDVDEQVEDRLRVIHHQNARSRHRL